MKEPPARTLKVANVLRRQASRDIRRVWHGRDGGLGAFMLRFCETVTRRDNRRTILFRSIGSRFPLRFRTCFCAGALESRDYLLCLTLLLRVK